MRVWLGMRQRKPLRAQSGDSGNIILELVLLLPLLLLFSAGVIDLGTLFWEKHILTNAAREGARAAARSGLAGVAELRQIEVKNVVYRYLYRFNLKHEDGTPLVTEQVKDVSYNLNAGTCNYNFPMSGPGTALSVELINIPVSMILLPNIQGLFGSGAVGSVLMLGAKSTMFTEWVTPPAP